jgi:hypothetical protein
MSDYKGCQIIKCFLVQSNMVSASQNVRLGGMLDYWDVGLHVHTYIQYVQYIQYTQYIAVPLYTVNSMYMYSTGIHCMVHTLSGKRGQSMRAGRQLPDQ